MNVDTLPQKPPPTHPPFEKDLHLDGSGLKDGMRACSGEGDIEEGDYLNKDPGFRGLGV